FMGIKKKNIGIIIFFLALLLLTFWNGFQSIDLSKNGVYTIATLLDVKRIFRGYEISISYKFNNKTYFIKEPNTQLTKKEIGKRYFVKILPNSPGSIFDMETYKLVPDSIKEPPENGWKEMPF